VGEVYSVPSLVRSEPRDHRSDAADPDGQQIALEDDVVRAAIDREFSKIVARMKKMAHIQQVLLKAWETGLMRRPGT